MSEKAPRADAHRLIPAVRRSPGPPPKPRGTRVVHLFTDGVRVDEDQDASLTRALRHAETDGNLTVIGYDLPTDHQIEELDERWELHPLLVEDLVTADQRPKLERYGDVLFLVVRSAMYRDLTEEVEFAEFHVLARGNVIVIMCQDRPKEQAWSLEQFGGDEELIARGPEAVIYTILDSIVDGYNAALDGLDVDKDQIERQVFTGDRGVTQRIYRLSREVIDLQHASSPLSQVLQGLRRGFAKYDVTEELQTHLQDVQDHLNDVSSRVSDVRYALNQILAVNSTLVTERQNEVMKKISGWAAILFAPTLIGAVYGMNFDHMPELHSPYGYYTVLAVMVAWVIGAIILFRRRGWL